MSIELMESTLNRIPLKRIQHLSLPRQGGGYLFDDPHVTVFVPGRGAQDRCLRAVDTDTSAFLLAVRSRRHFQVPLGILRAV